MSSPPRRSRRLRSSSSNHRGSSPSAPPPLSSSAIEGDGEEEGDDPRSGSVLDGEAEEGGALIDDGAAAAAAAELDEEGEDLFGDGLAQDYRAIAALDVYDAGDLDTRDYEEMDAAERRRVEEALNRRDEMSMARRTRIPLALLASDEGDDGDRELRGTSARRRRQAAAAAGIELAPGELDDAYDDEELINLEETKGNVRAYIALDGPQREIARRFKVFLESYVDARGNSVYAERIRSMCEENRESLEVSYDHMSRHAQTDLLAIWLAEYPQPMLEIFDEVARRMTLRVFPNYGDIQQEIHVRITDLPIMDTLRELRQLHLNGLVRVSGVVTRRTSVFPQLKYVKYDCGRCGFTKGPIVINKSGKTSVGSCPQCQATGPWTVNSQQTVYRNYQKITLQETPGTVPAGRLPRYKEIILLNDLIDSARPGEEIEVTGVYQNTFDAGLNVANGFPVFSTVIEANYIAKKEDAFAAFRLTEEDLKDIRSLSMDERIGEKIVRSIAPSVYGHDDVKLAVALALFGGTPKNVKQHRIRGDLNVLLLGDPGTAKSQFLKYVESTAHRAVFTTGQGASAVGLTASVRKDPITREWTLEGGALVLADQGVCMIDEFDKMNDQDRTSIHEAMEQQSISISKAGIVTTLQARCSIVAAANPLKGRYDASLPFNRNVDLTEPILSRFDILCVIRDTVDPVLDDMLARFVVASHRASHPDAEAKGIDAPTTAATIQGEMISQDILRKYIMYAKQNVRPVLGEGDDERIEVLYSELRNASRSHGGIPMTVRHIESIVRMAEAHARMHLRNFVRSDDISVAMRVMIGSFISSQKLSVQKRLERQFAKYMAYKRDANELLFYMLNGLVRDNLSYLEIYHSAEAPSSVDVTIEEFKQKASEVDIHDVTPFLESDLFAEAGFVVDEARAVIVKSF